MAKLTAQYNKYGYVIFKSGRPIYAAGNSVYESQGYIGILEVKKTSMQTGFLLRQAIPEDASVLSVDAIAERCESTITEMCDYPERWGGKLKEGVEYELGSIKFSRNLNPLEQAYKCGALTR